MPATEKPTLIYRITHVRNVPWILTHGLHASTSDQQDPDFVAIGLRDLIERRAACPVRAAPGGTLADYVPFYFGTHSLMLYNIHTGYNVPKVVPADIVYLVSSVERATGLGLDLVLTDRHAKVANANHFKLENGESLSRLDWPLIRGRDFSRDTRDPSKVERRAAECLIHRAVPLAALYGLACHTEARRQELLTMVEERDLTLTVVARPDWYF